MVSGWLLIVCLNEVCEESNNLSNVWMKIWSLWTLWSFRYDFGYLTLDYCLGLQDLDYDRGGLDILVCVDIEFV